jgi:hypothetical protein
MLEVALVESFPQKMFDCAHSSCNAEQEGCYWDKELSLNASFRE